MVRAINLAKELVERVSTDKSVSKDTKKWVIDTFAHEELPRTTMAFYMLFFMAHWKATSGIENTFNIWKKYLASELKKYVFHLSRRAVYTDYAAGACCATLSRQ